MNRSIALVALLVCVPQALRAQETLPAGPSFRAFLFGDVLYVTREKPQTDGFVVGQMVGHGNANLSDRVNFFAEVSATARSDAYAIEIERAILRYDFSDLLKVSVGRYHTPVSYWNTAFHHGTWLQTSVARPEIIKIGGRFLPVHFIGAMAEGSIGAHAATFSYEAGVGNGRGANIARDGDAGDVNHTRAVVFSAKVRPAAAGLQVGGSLYFDRIPVTAGAVNERIATAHAVWDRGAPELALEYARVQHDPRYNAPTRTSNGWYAHAGIRLPAPLAQFKPYVRLEDQDVDEPDPVFGATVTDYRAAIAGLRFDFDSFAALKAEFRSESIAGVGQHLKGLYLQASFGIPLSGGM